ncbi:DUF5996 family protein [Streptomyces arboris]|uniref:DUF5996 family protein n=1 Tax=Streptomyces arboris TaxID=2600619 RepID=UPI001CEFA31E|nr:DUF5996 family protein [Streptomyces arboris]
MSERTHAWPTLDHDELAPMVGYVNRVVQVAGKYTLDAPFEVGWGNTVLDVTPRGLRTPTFRQPGVAFTVHYRLLDGDVVIEADTGSRTVPLAKGSVASFFEEFCDAVAELSVDRPRTTLVCEIPDCAPTFQGDRTERTWDPRAARLMWEAWNIAAGGLEAWQAPFRGNHPRVGVMWGGFDLSVRPPKPGSMPLVSAAQVSGMTIVTPDTSPYASTATSLRRHSTRVKSSFTPPTPPRAITCPGTSQRSGPREAPNVPPVTTNGDRL